MLSQLTRPKIRNTSMAHCCHDDAPTDIRDALPDIGRLKAFCRDATREHLVIALDHVYHHCDVERDIIKEAIQYKIQEESLGLTRTQLAELAKSAKLSKRAAICAGLVALVSAVATVGSWFEAAAANRLTISTQAQTADLQSQLADFAGRLSALEQARQALQQTVPDETPPPAPAPKDTPQPMPELPTHEAK